MKYAVDLHIHSALSPCCDDDMTPCNIVNMALIKGLDFIAVTDHNTAQNLDAVCKCAEGKNLLVVPGMEIETCEEVHLVCLFPDVKAALCMQERVYNALPSLENRVEIFGRQYIMDEHDRITGCLKRLLLTAANLPIDEVFRMVGGAGGVAIPAHIDREAYSMLSNLGTIPDNLPLRFLEISRNCNPDQFNLKKHCPKHLGLIRSSDAHHLQDILERESFIELEERSVQCLLKALAP